MRTRFALAWVIVLSLLPSFAWAQPMADRIPGDAIIYIGWRGTDDMGPGYDASHLKAMVEASNLASLLDDYLPRLTKRMGEMDRDAGEVMEIVSALGSTVIRRPTAFYFGGITLAKGQPPRPQLALLCDAGKDAPALVERLKAVLAKLPQGGPVQLKAEAVANFVYVGTVDMSGWLGVQGANHGGPLSLTEAFTAAMKQAQKDPVCAVYVDVAKCLALVDDGIKMEGDAKAADVWAKLRESSGISGVKSLIWTCGFDGKDWASQAFIAAPAPRAGLVAALCDAKPVSDDMLKNIPQSATLASACRLDLARLMGDVRAFVGKLDPQAMDEFDRSMARAKEAIGLDIQQDVLGPLGDEWAIYTAPTTGGNSIAGLTLVNRLRDPAKAEAALSKLEQMATQMMAKQEQGGPGRPHIAFQTTKMGDLTIHYLGVPLVAPSWAINDGNLYIALFPQVISAAAEVGKGKSILENADYQALCKRLGVSASHGITFIDLPRSAPDAYGLVLTLARLLTGASDMFGVQGPMLVPPLNKILPHLSPAGAAGWADDAGIHFKAITPFPGANLLGSSGAITPGTAAMSLSILLPALNRAREQANRAKCANNLRSIGLGTKMFATNNAAGKLPDDLGQVLQMDMVTSVLVCPSSADVPATKPEQWADDGHCSYVYLGKGLKDSQLQADTILAYEKESNHHGDGMNILYGDIHVEWKPMAAAKKEIDAQMKKMQDNK